MYLCEANDNFYIVKDKNVINEKSEMNEGDKVTFVWKKKKYNGIIVMHSDNEAELDFKRKELENQSDESFSNDSASHESINEPLSNLALPNKRLRKKPITYSPEVFSQPLKKTKITDQKANKKNNMKEKIDNQNMKSHERVATFINATRTFMEKKNQHLHISISEASEPSPIDHKKQNQNRHTEVESLKKINNNIQQVHNKKKKFNRLIYHTSESSDSDDDPKILEENNFNNRHQETENNNEEIDSSNKKVIELKNENFLEDKEKTTNKENKKDSKSDEKSIGKENKKDDEDEIMDENTRLLYDYQLYGRNAKEMTHIGKGIYCKILDVEGAKSDATCGSQLIRRLIDGVFIPEKIINCTVTGRTRKGEQPVKLHPIARQAIIAKAQKMALRKKFPNFPSKKEINQTIRQKLCEIKKEVKKKMH